MFDRFPRWAMPVAGAIAVVGLGGAAYVKGMIPGSKPHMIQLTEATVASMLIDPESARFTNVVAVQQKSGGLAVCGEVNGKNRMGAYSGATRFHAGADGLVQLDDGNTLDFGDADRLQESCNNLRDNPYGGSVAGQICVDAEEARAKVMAARAFDDAHRLMCERS